MSKSGLFAHFGSKQELQLATVEAAAERFRDAVIEPALEAPDGAPRLRAMAERYLDHLDALLGRLLLGLDLGRVRRPARDRSATRSPARSTPGSASSSARPRIAGVEQPERFAFELYALVMGANSRFRLSGDPQVFDYARDALDAARGGAAGMSDAGRRSSARFAAYWRAPRWTGSTRCWRREVRLVAPLTPRTRPSPTGKRAFADLLALIPDLSADVHRWGPTEDGVLIEFTLPAARRAAISWPAVDRIALGEDGLATERVSYFDSLPLVRTVPATPARVARSCLRNQLGKRS